LPEFPACALWVLRPRRDNAYPPPPSAYSLRPRPVLQRLLPSLSVCRHLGLNSCMRPAKDNRTKNIAVEGDTPMKAAADCMPSDEMPHHADQPLPAIGRGAQSAQFFRRRTMSKKKKKIVRRGRAGLCRTDLHIVKASGPRQNRNRPPPLSSSATRIAGWVQEVRHESVRRSNLAIRLIVHSPVWSTDGPVPPFGAARTCTWGWIK